MQSIFHTQLQSELTSLGLTRDQMDTITAMPIQYIAVINHIQNLQFYQLARQHFSVKLEIRIQIFGDIKVF